MLMQKTRETKEFYESASKRLKAVVITEEWDSKVRGFRSQLGRHQTSFNEFEPERGICYSIQQYRTLRDEIETAINV